MARLRQYEIDILMGRLQKLINEHNDSLLTKEEIQAKADILLYSKLPELENLAQLEADYSSMGDNIKDLKKALGIKAVLEKLTTSVYFSLPIYENKAKEEVKKEAGFKTLNKVEARYQIMNSDNNNLEAIMNKMKELFNL